MAGKEKEALVTFGVTLVKWELGVSQDVGGETEKSLGFWGSYGRIHKFLTRKVKTEKIFSFSALSTFFYIQILRTFDTQQLRPTMATHVTFRILFSRLFDTTPSWIIIVFLEEFRSKTPTFDLQIFDAVGQEIQGVPLEE